MIDLLLCVIQLPELPEVLDNVVLTHGPVADVSPLLIVVHHQLKVGIVISDLCLITLKTILEECST